jgi:hypothetical protein
VYHLDTDLTIPTFFIEILLKIRLLPLHYAHRDGIIQIITQNILKILKKGGAVMDSELLNMTVREYLSKTRNERFEEELVRPKVEFWPDEWAAWVSTHRGDSKGSCHTAAKASPLCSVGLH